MVSREVVLVSNWTESGGSTEHVPAASHLKPKSMQCIASLHPFVVLYLISIAWRMSDPSRGDPQHGYENEGNDATARGSVDTDIDLEEAQLLLREEFDF